MLKMIAIAAAMLLPLPAAALECDYNYSIQRDYWWHKDQPETYVLVLGRFSNLDLIESFKTRETAEGIETGRQVFQADFAGFKASRRAFDQPFSTRVTLVFPDWSILGGGSDSSWMAEELPEKAGLVWLMQTQVGYEITVGPCDSVIDTEPARVKPALRCLRGGYCPK